MAILAEYCVAPSRSRVYIFVVASCLQPEWTPIAAGAIVEMKP